MSPARRLPKRDPVDEAFGRVLRSLRLKQGMSQEQLGHESGTGRTYVSQLERAEKGPTLKTVVRLSAVLAVSPSQIVRMVERELQRHGRTR